MGRITAEFERLKAAGKTGLVMYVTVGFPNLAETPALVQAAIAGGADIIELGVPFSDPLADGATNQRANQAALENGVTMDDCLKTAAGLRQAGVTVPLVLMGYYNTWSNYGVERWCETAAAAGVDGAIVVDLPPEEAQPLLASAKANGLDVVFLLAPTSNDDRIERVAKLASGFVYCVSLAGVTGARTSLPETLPAFLQRVRAHTTLPLAVGFGISQADHVAQVGKIAEAAVVGSALTSVIEQAAPGQGPAAVQAFVQGLHA